MEDRLHWSFGDNPILREKVFAEGFSAVESTLPDYDRDSLKRQACYDLVYTGPQNFTKDDYVYYGSLKITKRDKGGKTAIKVDKIQQLKQNFKFERHFIEAEFLCNSDKLFSLAPESIWQVKTSAAGQHDPDVKDFSKLNDSGRLKNGRLEKQSPDGKFFEYKKTSTDKPVVCDWSLLAALERFTPNTNLKFDYFPSLERLFANHQINFFEKFDARFGGRRIPLTGFMHKGDGIIPSYYWLDEKGTLLIARFGLSALVYNENPVLEREVKNG